MFEDKGYSQQLTIHDSGKEGLKNTTAGPTLFLVIYHPVGFHLNPILAQDWAAP